MSSLQIIRNIDRYTRDRPQTFESPITATPLVYCLQLALTGLLYVLHTTCTIFHKYCGT